MFLPTTKKEMDKKGWDSCDVIIVTPDAYVDHPSFAMAILGRFLEKNGYKVGILTQPRWKDPLQFLELGIPKYAFIVSGGQMDSMVLNYSSIGIPRNEDAFCENKNPFFSKKGEGKKYRIRPDRCLSVYCNQIRTACKGVPIIIGGIEASLRRIAHYDYWSNKVRRSILFDCKADMLIYGMGEFPLLKVIENIKNKVPFKEMNVENSAIIAHSLQDYTSPIHSECAIQENIGDTIILPSFEEVSKDKNAFAKAETLFIKNDNRKILAQKQDSRYFIQFPRRELTQKEIDDIYDLDFERMIHPRFKNVPAFEVVKTSITSHRGCYGDCSFCAIAAHQGKAIVSRSLNSIIKEVEKITKKKYFKGTISNIGGATANMYGSNCEIGGCNEHDCLKDGMGCKNLLSGTNEYLKVLNAAKEVNGVKNVFVNSGIRFDPCILDDEFFHELLKNNVSGQMNVAPESLSDKVLHYMNKPKSKVFEDFVKRFALMKNKTGVRKFLLPYMVIGHPGENEHEAIETRKFLQKHNIKGRQFQIFTPTPMTKSTAMYYLNFEPESGKSVFVEKSIRKLKKRKELMIQ